MKTLLPYVLLLTAILLDYASNEKNGILVAEINSNGNWNGAKTANLADPEIIGPDRLCNVFGSVIGTFSGMGNPDTDVYDWKIYGPSNQLLFSGFGGSGFQEITYTFQ